MQLLWLYQKQHNKTKVLSMHHYGLIDKKRSNKICIVCSRDRIESAIYPQVIKDAALAVEYLRLTDKDIAERYELRYLGEDKNRPAGWA